MASRTPEDYMYVVCFIVGAIGVILFIRNIMDVIKEEAKHRLVAFFFGLIGMIAGTMLFYWSVKCLVEFQHGTTETFRTILPLANKLLGK